MKFCLSCAAPLDNPQFKGPAEDYCIYCSDEQGALKSKEEVTNGVAGWFMEWQPNITPEKARERASYYLQAMPAWTE